MPKPQKWQLKNERVDEVEFGRENIHKPRDKDEKRVPRKAREMKRHARELVGIPLQRGDEVKGYGEIQHQNADKIVDKG